MARTKDVDGAKLRAIGHPGDIGNVIGSKSGTRSL